jgi:3-oxoadipate enol-lactonase
VDPLLDEGDGPVVVLVHGTPFDRTAWDSLVPMLPGRRVLRYDVRGHGAASATPVAPIEVLGADLLAVLDACGAHDAHLVGHSWGGQIVQAAALAAPERVRRLSLVCTRSGPFPAFADLAVAVRAGTARPLDSMGRWFTAAELAQAGPAVEQVTALLHRADPDVWADALDEIAVFDVLDRLPELSMPVDVIAAEHDAVGTPDHMASIADALPGGRLHVVPDARHLLPLQRPSLVADLLLA